VDLARRLRLLGVRAGGLSRPAAAAAGPASRARAAVPRPVAAATLFDVDDNGGS
jgi:hypothetical protein